jgi:hypothetical protein
MDSNVRKTLEREWQEQARTRLEEVSASREAVKKELVDALKERMAEIKEAAKQSRAGKPLGQRIAEASGFNLTEHSLQQAEAARALKLLTRERSEIPIDPKSRSFSEHLKADQKNEVMQQKHGFSNYGPSREEWVTQQASERASATGLKPPSREVPQGSPEIAQILKDQRAERVKALVKDMTSINGTTSAYSIEGHAWTEMATRAKEEKEASQFRGREIDPAVTARSQQQEQAPSRESFEAVAAIQSRAQIYNEAAAEMGSAEAASALSKDDAKVWVDADERQLKSIANELDAEDAKEAISENFVNAPTYSQEAENAALLQQADSAIANHQVRLNEEVVRLEREREVISENAYAAINNRFSDMRERDVESAGQMQPSDAAELARADVSDLGKISKPELAANAADVIAYNMANSADYQSTVERTLKELEASNADAAVIARQSVEQGLAAHALREEQMNAREVELQQAADQLAAQRAELLADPELAQGIAMHAGQEGEAIPEVINDRLDLVKEYEKGLNDRATDFAIAEQVDHFVIPEQDKNTLAELRKTASETIAAMTEQEEARQAEADYNTWNREQSVEHPERHNRLGDDQRRAEYAAQGTDQAAEVIAANDAALRVQRDLEAASADRRTRMTDDEKRAEFAATPDQEAIVRAQTDAAIAARQAEREQQLDDPFGPALDEPAVNAPADARSVEQEMDRQLTLNEAERLAEKEAVTDADLASVRAANDAAVASRALDQTAPDAELDPFGPALEEPTPNAPADARSIEQEMDRQLTLTDAERLAEQEAVTEAELASVRAANDAAVASRALDQTVPEAELDPFGPALDDVPQPTTAQASSELDVANSIEPVSIREAVNDPSVPVKEREAANQAQNGEEIVLDAQTLAQLARARAADREAVEQQLGHAGEERRPAPAPEQKAEPEFVDRRSRDNQVESDEIMTANRETRKPVLPPEVERQYVSVGTKYYDHKKPDVVAFEDKGNRLETRSNNEEVASNLVKIAEARGWDEIKVSGSETFRKEVWAEAAARGMQVKGYTPTEQDKASLAARLHSRDANKVEPVKSQERASAESPEKQRAESFQKDSREVALKKHPELAGAYAAQSAMQKKMEADRLSPEQQAVVKARVNKNIVNSIEAGKIPEVNRREEVTKHRDVSVSEEREQSR